MPEKPLKLPHAVIRPAFTGILFEKKFEIRILGGADPVHSPQKWSIQNKFKCP
jgi:hypothetical protein